MTSIQKEHPSLPISLLQTSNSYFSSGSGFNLLIRLIQYTSKILAYNKFHEAQFAKLATIISDSRFLFRFWGVFDTFEELHTALVSRSLTPLNRILEIIKAGSMVGYYPLEHLYWLKWRGVLPAGKWLDVDEFSYWSCRFWVVYILADMIQDIMRLRSIPPGKAKIVYTMKWVKNVCDLLLGWHWSVKGGLFNEGEVGWLGTVGSVAGIAGLLNSR